MSGTGDLDRFSAEAITRHGPAIAYRWRDRDGTAHTRTWDEFGVERETVARSLRALGVAPGDRVAILGSTSYRWVLIDFATVSIGAATVGLHVSTPAGEIRSLLEHAGCRVAFIEDEDLADRVRALGPRGVERVIFSGPAGAPAGHAWREFLAPADRTGGARGDDARSASSGPRPETTPDAPAAIVYTSGTTGAPRGVVLTHDNFVFTAQAAAARVDTRAGEETILFLPLAHVFARLCVHVCFRVGVTTTFVTRPEEFAVEVARANPHWFVAVPRLFERIVAAADRRIQGLPPWRRALVEWSLGVGREASDRRLAGKRPGLLLRAKARLADRIALRRLRGAFGSRLRFCISGAAPLDPSLARYFHAAGVTILEGFGLTECTSFSHVNELSDVRFGTVGRPAPGIEQRLSPDGELLLRGRNVMAGYWRDPEATASVLSPEGWLATGDIGRIDPDGFLTIVDRKKDLIVTSTGRNVAPAPLESALRLATGASHAVVFGDRRSHLVALLAFEPGAAADEHEGQAVRGIRGLNAELPPHQRVHRFAIVPPLSEADGLLTATSKTRRAALAERYASLLEGLWRGEGGLTPDAPDASRVVDATPVG